MTEDRNTPTLADLHVTAEGLVPHLGGGMKLLYGILLLLLLSLMILAFTLYL